MSRIISHNNLQLTGVPSVFIGSRGTYGAIQSTGPADNAFTSANSDTYCDYNPATGGEGGPVFGFNSFDSIPDSAVINSVSCQVKIRCSNNNGMTTGLIQLYSGDTAKGDAINFANSTSLDIRTFTNTGQWTREELDNLNLRITARRQSTRRVYFYGADLTINYSYDEVQYEITTSSSSSTVTISPSSQYVTKGDSGTVTLNNITDLAETGVFDNGDGVSIHLVNTSGTTYTYTIDGIDADHTITVEDVQPVYLTVTNNTSKVSSIVPPSGTTLKIAQGTTTNVKIYTDEPDHIVIYDDGVKHYDLTLMDEWQETTTNCVPGSYSNNGFTGSSTSTSFTGAYTDTDSTTRVILSVGARNTAQSIYFNFDVSSIPSNAIIHSVRCRFKVCVSNDFSTTSTGIWLYSGTTMKSSRHYSTWITSTSPDVYELSGVGDFTREELNNARLLITGRASSANRFIYFYGASLEVEYEYIGDHYYSYETIVNSNKTVTIDDKPSYLVTASSSVTGDSISPTSLTVYDGESVTFTLTISDISSVNVSDNGVSIINQLTGSSPNYTYTLSNVTGPHTLAITEQGGVKIYMKNVNWTEKSKVYQKRNGHWEEVQDVTNLFQQNQIYIFHQ